MSINKYIHAAAKKMGLHRKKLKEQAIRLTEKKGFPIYVIRRKHKAGFFSNFFYVLGNIVYAKEKQYSVAVDMQYYKTLYNEKKAVNGTRNAWEYYFEQPDNLSVNKALKSGNFILSSGEYPYEYVPYYVFGIKDQRNLISRENVNRLFPYYEQYVRIKKDIIDEADKMFSRMVQKSERVLGVHFRGTDLRSAKNHPETPSLTQYDAVVSEMIRDDKYDKILLCTDEMDILYHFKNEYPDKVVYTDSLRSEDGTPVHKSKKRTRENDNYLKGKEVLLDALLLSRCDSIVCGHSNVAYASILMNNNHYRKVTILSTEDTITWTN